MTLHDRAWKCKAHSTAHFLNSLGPEMTTVERHQPICRDQRHLPEAAAFCEPPFDSEAGVRVLDRYVHAMLSIYQCDPDFAVSPRVSAGMLKQYRENVPDRVSIAIDHDL